MIRWLLLAFIIYLLFRLFFKTRKKSVRSPFTFYFDRHNYNDPQNKKAGKSNLEHIEEADFEDITEKENKKDEAN
ncbi:MAG: hypothetical protein ACFCU6_10245 [Balneolaceae bacterium]